MPLNTKSIASVAKQNEDTGKSVPLSDIISQMPHAIIISDCFDRTSLTLRLVVAHKLACKKIKNKSNMYESSDSLQTSCRMVARSFVDSLHTQHLTRRKINVILYEGLLCNEEPTQSQHAYSIFTHGVRVRSQDVLA